MKIIFFLALMGSGIILKAQEFPGLGAEQKQRLLKTGIPLPLPGWVPDGFAVSNIVTKTGRSVKIENKVLEITYSKKLPNGPVLEFTIGAGFDGIGSLPYEGAEIIKSKAGKIYLCYEPFDEDENGKKIKQVNFIMTEWFDIKNLAFHVVFGKEDSDLAKLAKSKLSKADVKKILQSMQVLR